jgi:hypothetical protein
VSDWERFVDEVSWFVTPGQDVVVGGPAAWVREPVDGLPVLSALLAGATVTPVSVDGVAYELLAWGDADKRRGWLAQPPYAGQQAVAPVHRSFWRVCGGIVERFGEPDTWWRNHDEVLTPAAVDLDVYEALVGHPWPAGIPLDTSDYYVAAVEANGNLTLVHRADGRLLLFAQDHDFAGVSALPGCEPYSLMTIDGVPDLTTWIETCAQAWRG